MVFTFTLGTLELLAFFAADIVFAKSLNELKQDHPVIDDCAPQQSPDLDAATILNTLKDTANDIYSHEVGRFTGSEAATMGSNRGAYESVPSASEAEEGRATGSSSSSEHSAAKNGVHLFVLFCGLFAPFLALLQLIAPSFMSFTRFPTPVWMQCIAIIPGLGIAALYVSRTMQVSMFNDVTMSQWLSLMWFRLDLLCLFGVLTLIGLGCWLIAVCMLSVALYLAHRLLLTEKRLNREKNATQLLRREVDLEHVYAPGTEEAKRALGEDRNGYSAVN